MEDTKSRPRPPEAGKVRVVAQEKLTNVPGKMTCSPVCPRL